MATPRTATSAPRVPRSQAAQSYTSKLPKVVRIWTLYLAVQQTSHGGKSPSSCHKYICSPSKGHLHTCATVDEHLELLRKIPHRKIATAELDNGKKLMSCQPLNVEPNQKPPGATLHCQRPVPDENREEEGHTILNFKEQ